MSILDKQKIDIIGIQDNQLVMIICDHLEWTDNDSEDDEHLLLLQDKLNCYLGSYENGEIFQKYPNSNNKPLKIIIAGQYCLNKKGIWFINQVREKLKSLKLDIKLVFEWYDYREDD